MQQMVLHCKLIVRSTCFGYHYAHHQELESIIQVVAACGTWCFGLQVAGLVWNCRLCVRFAGCCSILEYRLLVSNVRLARSSHVQFATCDSVRMKLSLQYRDSVVFVVCQSTDMGRAVL